MSEGKEKQIPERRETELGHSRTVSKGIIIKFNKHPFLSFSLQKRKGFDGFSETVDLFLQMGR